MIFSLETWRRSFQFSEKIKSEVLPEEQLKNQILPAPVRRLEVITKDGKKLVFAVNKVGHIKNVSEQPMVALSRVGESKCRKFLSFPASQWKIFFASYRTTMKYYITVKCPDFYTRFDANCLYLFSDTNFYDAIWTACIFFCLIYYVSYNLFTLKVHYSRRIVQLNQELYLHLLINTFCEMVMCPTWLGLWCARTPTHFDDTNHRLLYDNRKFQKV